MENVFGNKLVSARKMAGMSLQDLENRLEKVVTRQALHKYEQGLMKPDSRLIISLSNVLNVPIDYFFSIPKIKVELKNISYRKYASKISKIEQLSIEEKTKEICERFFEIEDIIFPNEKTEFFKYEKVIENVEDVENAAKKLREDWFLGNDPIPDVVEMLEDKGYTMIDLEAPLGFDGMKAEVESKKIIVQRKIDKKEDVVRKRFTALHELAHHALLFSPNMSEKEEEKLCHTFASAVLFPADKAIKELSIGRFHFYQNELVLIKERWGISFSAIFSRALHLGIVSSSTYKKLNIGYRMKGLHLNEPGRYMSKEKPLRFKRLILIGLSKEIFSINEAAYFAGKTIGEFRKNLLQLI